MLKNKVIRIFFHIIIIVLMIIMAFIVYYNIVATVDPPEKAGSGTEICDRNVVDSTFIICGNNWIRRNDQGIWEIYLDGGPYESGLVNGMLTQELIHYQEKAFIREIRNIIPSGFYLRFLRHMIGIFNRNLDRYVPREYKLEIYGISQYASEEFDFIGPAYARILNYHAAHDIGHALQNMNLVACTGFGVWQGKSQDSALIVGRNFDFHVGDEFNRHKIVAFTDPDSGHSFMSITWAGMTGVVSGMNEKGLTVTLNAAKSAIPSGSRTPVSIVARDILQYAGNIDEAIKIAGKYKTFVSESFLIGSAYDNKAVVIEKRPDTMAIYDPGENSIILTNHFQSEAFRNDDLVIENLENETSLYRYKRVEELLNAHSTVDIREAASILRDQKGHGGSDIGMGNEKSINQLIAHHSVIFKPGELKAWVSSSPFQLGEYLCYDLKKVFPKDHEAGTVLYDKGLNIPADSFLFSEDYENFLRYKKIRDEIGTSIRENIPLDPQKIEIFKNSNPDFYLTYATLGDYFMHLEKFELALNYYNLALGKEIDSRNQRELIQSKMARSKRFRSK